VAGEGSIFQLPNGKWRAVADLGYVDGKRKRKAVTRDTHRECEALLSMGAAVEVLRPVAVPERVAAQARAIAAYYG
jgi:integrase